MRRRHQRSPQNHALVASVAGVILLCGVVSVQTTQASQAFSHEQGMARMAAPQGSDAGATTAGDADERAREEPHRRASSPRARITGGDARAERGTRAYARGSGNRGV